jgi:hypothetical protein
MTAAYDDLPALACEAPGGAHEQWCIACRGGLPAGSHLCDHGFGPVPDDACDDCGRAGGDCDLSIEH